MSLATERPKFADFVEEKAWTMGVSPISRHWPCELLSEILK